MRFRPSLLTAVALLGGSCVLPQHDAANWPEVVETITAGRLDRVLEHGVDLEAYSDGGLTALEVAVWNGRPLPLVEILLDAGASVEVRGIDEGTLLHGAVHGYRGEVGPVLTCLVEAGVDPRAVDSRGRTIARDAAGRWRNDSFAWVLEARLFDWTPGGDGPATIQDFEWCSDILIEDLPHVAPRLGAMLAAWRESAPEGFLAGLPLQGILFRRHLLGFGGVAGHEAGSLAIPFHAMLEELDRVGFPKDLTDGRGWNLLHAACSLGQPDAHLIPWLLDRGVDPMALTDAGSLPIHIWARREGWSPHWAEELDALLAAGNRIDAKDGFGNTPIDIAWRVGARPNYHMIEALERRGAPVLD